MPLFEIQRQSDLKTFRVDALDVEGAVNAFSALLNVNLALTESDTVAELLMRQIKPNIVSFVKYDIPVYIIEA